MNAFFPASVFIGVASASALTVVPNGLELSDLTWPFYYTNAAGLTIFQNKEQTDYTTAILAYSAFDEVLTYVTTVIDEGSDWYFVAAGEPFSFARITSGDFVMFSANYETGFPMPPGEFYLGGTTGQGFGPNGPARTVLSWGRFRADENGLTLLDSAVAYDAASLDVGTLFATPIPEPATSAALVGMTILGACALRRRKRHA